MFCSDSLAMRENIVFILGEEEEYTVKYTTLSEGVPEGAPEGKGVYLTVYPEFSPNTDSNHFNSHKANSFLISLIDNYSVYSLGSVL